MRHASVQCDIVPTNSPMTQGVDKTAHATAVRTLGVMAAPGCVGPARIQRCRLGADATNTVPALTSSAVIAWQGNRTTTAITRNQSIHSTRGGAITTPHTHGFSGQEKSITSAKDGAVPVVIVVWLQCLVQARLVAVDKLVQTDTTTHARTHTQFSQTQARTTQQRTATTHQFSATHHAASAANAGVRVNNDAAVCIVARRLVGVPSSRMVSVS